MLLPKIDVPVNLGQIGLPPYEVMNQNSITQQVMRSLRQMHGHDAYLLSISGSEAKADFLASFAGLSKDDRQDEQKLSAALDGLLCAAIEACDEATNGYPDEDQRILRAIAARSLKSALADAMTVFVEDAAAQLAEMRANAA